MTRHPLVNPEDTPERSVEKLAKIADALMRRVEQATDSAGDGYAHFQQAVMLEEQVRARTRDLEKTLRLLNEANAGLAEANEAALQARADLYNAIEAVQEGFAIFGADDALIMCNSRFCRAMPDVWEALAEGLSFEDYVRLVSESAHLDLSGAGAPADWAARRRRLHEDDHVMFNVRLKSGEWLQVGEYRTQAGGTAIIQTDVTEMIRLERAERDKLLDDQAQLVKATLDHINQGVCIFDREARLVGWNDRLGELLSPPMRLVRVGARFLPLFAEIAKGAVFDGATQAHDVVAWVERARARAPLAFDMRGSGGVTLSVFAQETPDRGFVISFTDVTAEREAIAALNEANAHLERRVRARTLELEDALDEAERANASKSRFVAAASHDLLQPLSAAKLFVTTLAGMDLGADATNAAERALSAVDGVEAILSALLEISKLDSGKAVFHREPTNLAALLDSLEREFAPMARAKGLRFRLRGLDVVVDSDPVYLRRILQNLIVNAIRYTSDGGVLVGVRRREGGVRVEVLDTGPGVPEEKREEIFREFRRLDGAGDATQGMGLGLTIVERACRFLGHPLSLRSEVGRGSRFAVGLPLATSAAALGGATATDLTGVSGRQSGAERLILIVEDDPEVSAALAMLFETWGMAAFEAVDGASALALLEETGVAPDFILADYTLKGGETGLDVIAALRRAFGPIPAAIASANREAAIRRTCEDAGVPFMSKPIETMALLQLVSVADAGGVES